MKLRKIHLTLNYKKHSKVDLQWYFTKDLTILWLKNKSTMSERQQMWIFSVGQPLILVPRMLSIGYFCMLHHWEKVCTILNLFTNVKSLGAKTSTE